MSRPRVVLTGRGVVSPLGIGIEQHWEALVAGRCAVSLLPRLAGLGLPSGHGAVVSPELLQPGLGRLPRKQQKLYNRATLLGMLAALLALEDAGLGGGVADPERFGVLLGVNVLAWDLAAMTRYLVESESVDHPGVLDMSRANRYCMHQINPLDFSLKTLPNLAAGHAAIAYNAQAICRALTEGPVGGVHAVGQAYRFVAEGDLDVALCGGADAPVEEMVFATYAGSRFFGWEAEGEPGPIGGEGAGLLVLEAAEHARERGAVVRAEVLGFSATAGDGTPVPDTDPDRLAERIAATVNAVIEEAGTRPDVVSLHGDGGVVHDAAEARALAAVLGDAATGTARVAMKPQHGDLGAGSGPVELAACSMLLERAIIPPVAWQPPKQPSAPPRSALLIALGFFGECAALMLGRTSPEGERAA